MIRTQVQIPDRLYRELKRVAEEHEMSLAEVIRRGAEYITQVYKPHEVSRDGWRLPGPFDLGVKNDPFGEDWRYKLNMGTGAAAMVREEKDAEAEGGGEA
jgi:hypothetical protein